MSGAPAYPGCDVPSIVIGVVMLGRGDIRRIVCAPVPTLKSIVFGPGLEFARPISQRSVPEPLSALLVTVNVESSLRSSSTNTVGRIRRRCLPVAVPRRLVL